MLYYTMMAARGARARALPLGNHRQANLTRASAEPSENQERGLTYKAAGVDVDKGNELARRFAGISKAIGGFGGCYQFGQGHLVAGVDGVGTKLAVAQAMGQHGTVGIDLVAMSVNDVVAQGADPLFFLDYVSTGELRPEVVEEVVRGVAEGCEEAGCALLGGETAEMPGFYSENQYDLAGFCVGYAPPGSLLDPSRPEEGDAIVGLPSTGVHSNGFSLARRAIQMAGYSLSDTPQGFPSSIGEALLTPTAIYAMPLSRGKSDLDVLSAAHITGGGMPDNLPRALPDGLGAEIHLGSWNEPAIFRFIQECGGISDEEMRRTFNMGIGMCLVVPASNADAALESLAEDGACLIGRVSGTSGVHFLPSRAAL